MSTVLITGANRGLGLAHVRRFTERGWRVYAGRRAGSKADALHALADGAENLSVFDYDAADPDAPAAVKAAMGDARIDVLFNNAGASNVGGGGQSLDDVEADAITATIAVNAVAPLMLTRALIDNVAASEKRIVANQSSLMGSIADNGMGGGYVYRTSKTALNMITRSLSRDLSGRGVIVVALHPGWVKTDMGGENAPLSQDESIAGQQNVIDGLTADSSGRFFNYDGEELPW